MIKLTTLDNRAVVINAELIERVEAVPETVITLTSGKKLLVKDSVDEVVALVIRYRRAAYCARDLNSGYHEVNDDGTI
ncbi:hypothetical protein SY88_04075 [Clostridiales bacterium PH28_bin88]|nr:hypothetical protein SY88_04075 [Clostridiales bacterium PH28_bin88]